MQIFAHGVGSWMGDGENVGRFSAAPFVALPKTN